MTVQPQNAKPMSATPTSADPMRVQIALNVPELEPAIEFYRKMFDTEPAKVRPGYANFAIDTPPLKLVLFEAPNANQQINHLGVEAQTEEAVSDAIERLQHAELPVRIEEEAVCCYAKSNKVWSASPDGVAWEWYKVLADAERR